MPDPEEYNVLHIDSECESDRALVREAKKGRISSLAGFFSLGVMILGVGMMSFFFQRSLTESESQIAALIDEVGSLSQANLELSEHFRSQEAVLQSLEDDFTELDSAVTSGDSTALQSALAAILGRLSSVGDFSVELAEEGLAAAEKDSTFDILILGTNGIHNDSILVASINGEKEKTSLFSIPRDLYVNGRRINEYYTNYGIAQLSRMVESVTGLQMDRYAQVDLEGFVEIVDILGGLDIYVSEPIYDALYPNGPDSYTTYSIEQGYHHLDGEAALKYARSRHSTSDFDRAERQQEILSALRQKVIQLDSVRDLKEITQIFQTALSATATDLDLLELLTFYYDYRNFDLNTGFVLTSGNYLYSIINESGAYILLPKGGNFDEIREVISDLVN